MPIKVVDEISTGPRPEAPCATFTVLESDKSTVRNPIVERVVGNPCVSHRYR